MLCRVGANLVFALFLCGVGNIRTQISQMGAPPFVIPNVVRNPVGKRKKILRFALNDKLIVNGQLLCVVHGIRTPSFVIPNIVRNLASNASAFVPSASGGEPTEQRAGRKKIRLSEAKRVT